MVLAGVSDHTKRLFLSHGILPENVPEEAYTVSGCEAGPSIEDGVPPPAVLLADTLDAALEWCEDDILGHEASEHHRRVSITLPGIEGEAGKRGWGCQMMGCDEAPSLGCVVILVTIGCRLSLLSSHANVF
jgi:hypothetical protein